MTGMTIGEIARESGVGVETIRFYQREGLVAEPPRRGAAFRRYPPDVVRRVRFIRAAKDVGFSLKDIRELLAIRASDLRTCEKVKRRAEEKIEAIEEKLLELGRMRDGLRRVADICSGRCPLSECSILDAIDAAAEGVPKKRGRSGMA